MDFKVHLPLGYRDFTLYAASADLSLFRPAAAGVRNGGSCLWQPCGYCRTVWSRAIRRAFACLLPQVGDEIQLPRGIAQVFSGNSGYVEQREMQVRHRRPLGIGRWRVCADSNPYSDTPEK